MDNSIIKSEQNIITFLENALTLTDKFFEIDIRPLQILHLDDHLIYQKGVEKCLRKKFPNAIIKSLINGDDALNYVKYALGNDIIIDLIISDVRHPGLDGLVFGETVRKLEKETSRIIPVLFLTMSYNDKFKERMEYLPMVKFLPKNATCEEINLAIENLT